MQDMTIHTYNIYSKIPKKINNLGRIVGAKG
jgi:hypothetical protein